ncbi:hypothetical protein M407DRAFT_22717, partial [Tulasnella calospora MUT 4182]
GDWDLYRLLNDYVESFLQWKTSEASRERARTEGEIQSLRGINDTLEQTLRTGDDLQKKLSSIEDQFTTLRARSKEKAAVQQAVLEETTTSEPDLPDARPSEVAVQAKPEQEADTSQSDPVQTEAVPMEEPEQSGEKDQTTLIAEHNLDAKPDSPTLPLETAGEQEQSQDSLTQEVATLGPRKSLGEGGAKRLGELNAAFLARSNSSQGTWRNKTIAPTERPSKSIAELRAQFGARK